jgi:RNA polymerase sigma factor (TIGR02999 family)
MEEAVTREVTRLLREARGGDRSALEQVLPLVYDDLHQRAARAFAHERAGHTLQPTALVSEAYLRLAGMQDMEWVDRAHFFAVSAVCMRRILVDHARRHGAARRGGDRARVDLDAVDVVTRSSPTDLLALHEAMERLEAFDERKAKVAELKLFGGLENRETAEAMGISVATVERDWRMARAWLHRELGGSGARGAAP